MSIKVFISYSHDSPTHMDRVWNLSERLRRDGIDCTIDQHEASPPEGWPRWCRDRLDEADFVIVVCTAIYYERYLGKVVGSGLGVNWEGHAISQDLYDSESKNRKFIPVVFRNKDVPYIPRELRSTTRFVLKSDAAYDGLLRRITNQPERRPAIVSEKIRSLPTHWGPVPLSAEEEEPSGNAAQADAVAREFVGTTTAPDIVEALLGSHTIQIFISQHFRIADLLIYPESVRSHGFAEVIRDMNKMWRAVNKRKEFKLGELGSIRPVATIDDRYDNFRKKGVSNFRSATEQQLWFMPFGLDLTEYFMAQEYDTHSMLNEILGEAKTTIDNQQVSCRLRIYPPGVGVVRIGITLRFKQAIIIDSVSRIVQDLEDAFFVNPKGDQRAFADVLVKIIDEVSETLFRDQQTTGVARRWRPPETTYCIRDDDKFLPEQNVKGMARLMSLVPENEEETDSLERRLAAAITSAHWRQNRVLAVSGDKVSLLYLEKGSTDIGKRKQEKLMQSLLETAEVVSAGSYSERALVEELATLYEKRLLEEKWPGWRGEKIDFISRLLHTLKLVLLAIASARADLRKLGSGVLMRFATEIWWQSHTGTSVDLRNGLSYVEDWIRQQKIERADARGEAMLHDLREIEALAEPFRSGVPRVQGEAKGLNYAGL